MRLLAIACLLVGLAMSPGVRAQPTPVAAPPASALTPAQAQAVLNVLQDDKARAQFTTVLENMVRAVPAMTPEKPSAVPLAADSVGAQLLVAGSHWATELAGQFATTARAVGDVPLLWRWAQGTAMDPAARMRVLDTGWKLIVILVVARAIEWGVRRLLARARRVLSARAPADEPIPVPPDGPDVQGRRHPNFSVAWRALRRLPFVLVGLLLDLIPVAVFAAMGHALLTTPLGATTNTRLVVLAIVDAYVICRVIMCITRSFVSPRDHRLRLIQCDDQAAAFIEIWVRRISAVGVFGFAAAEVGLLFGLYNSAHDVLLKLVGLVVHVLLVIVVIESRHAVANRLRARRRKTGLLASMQNHFAANWHLIAIFYIVALWLVAAARNPQRLRAAAAFLHRDHGDHHRGTRLAGIILLGAPRPQHADRHRYLRHGSRGWSSGWCITIRRSACC